VRPPASDEKYSAGAVCSEKDDSSRETAISKSLPVKARPIFEPSRRTASWLLALKASIAKRAGGAATADMDERNVVRESDDGKVRARRFVVGAQSCCVRIGAPEGRSKTAPLQFRISPLPLRRR
jgi:hypothetical protein